MHILHPAVILRNIQRHSCAHHSIAAIGTNRNMSVHSLDLQGFSGRKENVKASQLL